MMLYNFQMKNRSFYRFCRLFRLLVCAVKFETHLKDSMVKGWESYYLSYTSLKAEIDNIRKVEEQKETPASIQETSECFFFSPSLPLSLPQTYILSFSFSLLFVVLVVSMVLFSRILCTHSDVLYTIHSSHML
jgi:hypothetical protein